MIRSLWIAKSGLEAQQTQMDTISNNLANVNTSGFKRSRTEFEDMLYQNLRQNATPQNQPNGMPSGLQVGTGSRPVATERIHSQGSLLQTEKQFDLAINGDGFLTVLLPNGTLAYTRDGAFQKNAQGQLVNASGYPLQPPVVVPDGIDAVDIGSDGLVTARQPGGEPVQIGAIQLATFTNAAGLESKGGNLYGETLASGQPRFNVPNTGGAGSLNQGFLENSNVNVVEELVNMIQTQRAFEINSKAISASDQMLQKLSQL